MGKSRNIVLLKKIAARIKQIRENSDLTQEIFLHDTGINIGRIERGERDISMTTLGSVCKYFDVSLKEFFKDFKE